MLRAHLDTQIANEVIKNGTMPKLIESMMERLKPEAAYFGPGDGMRTCTFVFDMEDSSQVPVTVEPLFGELGARIEIQPVMNTEDLQKGLAALRQG